MLPHLYLDSITTLAIPVNLGHANKVFKYQNIPSGDFRPQTSQRNAVKFENFRIIIYALL